MHTVRRFCLTSIACLLLAPHLIAQTTPCTCNGFNKDRATDWSFVDGDVFARARAKLTDSSFFGASGVVNRRIVIGPGMQIATDTTLSQIDIFWTGYARSDSYTPAEKTALQNAVNNGMNIVVTCDDKTHCLSDLFGVAFEDGGAEMNSPALPDHPIFAGPFGRVIQFRGASQMGRFTSWPASARLLATSSAGASMLLIPRGAISSGAGAVLLLADTDLLTTYLRETNRNISEPSIPVTDALVMNVVAHLCNPTAVATAPHMVFPQFANGQNNISSLNLTSADNNNPVSANFYFRDDNGNKYSVNMVGLGAASNFFTGNIPNNQTLTYTTDGAGPLTAGWASVVGSSPLMGGNVLFFAPGLGATGVGATPMAGGFVLPVVQQPTGTTPIDVYTGLAICNLTAKSAEVRLELWDNVGKRADGTQFLALPAYGHVASFLFQIYPSSVIAGFKGSLRVVSTNALISVTALQLGSSPGQFTALPVTPQFR